MSTYRASLRRRACRSERRRVSRFLANGGATTLRELTAVPIYEFQCSNHHRTELRQRINEPRSSFIRCSVCGEIARRIFSVPRIIVYMNFHEAEEYYNSPAGQAEYD